MREEDNHDKSIATSEGTPPNTEVSPTTPEEILVPVATAVRVSERSLIDAVPFWGIRIDALRTMRDRPMYNALKIFLFYFLNFAIQALPTPVPETVGRANYDVWRWIVGFMVNDLRIKKEFPNNPTVSYLEHIYLFSCTTLGRLDFFLLDMQVTKLSTPHFAMSKLNLRCGTHNTHIHGA